MNAFAKSRMSVRMMRLFLLGPGLRQVLGVVQRPGKNLPFWYSGCPVDIVGTKVLDQHVLSRTVRAEFRDVPQRRRMAFGFEEGISVSL